jgi:hypothetical protein
MDAWLREERAALTLAHVQASQRENHDIIDRYELRQAERALEDARREYEKVLNNAETRTWAPSSPQARTLEEVHDHYDLVRAGQEALVWANALRDETLHGRVIAIYPLAVVQQGDTTYTLMIKVEPTDLNLRPGMTAQVRISTGDRP